LSKKGQGKRDRASVILEEARSRAAKRHKPEGDSVGPVEPIASGVEAWCRGVSKDCVEETERDGEEGDEERAKGHGRADAHLEDLLGESPPSSTFLSPTYPGECIIIEAEREDKAVIGDGDGPRSEGEVDCCVSEKEDCRVPTVASCCVIGTSTESDTKYWCKESRQELARRAAAAA
jgi:hypothetical protein